jgi:hypothetical protein
MKKNRKHYIVQTVVLVFFLTNISFQSVQSDIVVPVATNDFSFISTYYCIYELFGKEQWENNPTRSFDSAGVHLTNGKYHPVNACHYALFCYDEYNKTGVERFKKAFLAQIAYLRDSTKYDEYDNYKIGYPYKIPFHDIKPPWYSALAQSEAISVLVRYYAMTKDATVLPLIVKLKNFMIAPQSDGKGTMNYTPEGYVWYEEYPVSPQEKEVLNGFFLAIVALYDYTHLFPADTATKKLYSDALTTAKNSIRFYDTGTWLKYNRGDQRLVANGYMKWEVLEMKLLYAITHDEIFQNLYMLWSTYAYEKPYEAPGCKMTDYNFSLPVVTTDNEFYKAIYKSAPIRASELDTCICNKQSAISECKKLIDNNPATYVDFSADSGLSTIPEFEFVFKEEKEIKQEKFSIVNAKSISAKAIKFFYKTSDQHKSWKNITVKNFSIDSTYLVVDLQPVIAKRLKVVLPEITNHQVVRIQSIDFYPPAEISLSPFIHYTSKIYKTEKNNKFSYVPVDIQKSAIFYKVADTEDALKKQRWDETKVSKTNSIVYDTDSLKYIQFLVVAQPKTTNAGLKNILFIN